MKIYLGALFSERQNGDILFEKRDEYICFICLILQHKDTTQWGQNDEEHFQTFSSGPLLHPVWRYAGGAGQEKWKFINIPSSFYTPTLLRGFGGILVLIPEVAKCNDVTRNMY